jgi:hypothetical protein
METLDIRDRIEQANQETMQRVYESDTLWVGVERAIDVIPGMTKRTILHAGPPISYDSMCVPQQIAVRGALIYEGLAKDMEEADGLARGGGISLEPCHAHQTVGSMCGITSASMPVNIVKNSTYGNNAYCTNFESPRRERMTFGYYDDNILRQLKWHEEVLMPALQLALNETKGINVKRIISKAITMGDECHSRNAAATALLAMELMPLWLNSGIDIDKLKEAVEFITMTDMFFLHLSMASCKATADAADEIEFSTIVTAIARNGVETGIRVSGLPGKWFTAPADMIDGIYFAGYGIEDAVPDLGDSAITETMGLGAAAMAAAPALDVVGGKLEKALNTTREMDEITVGNNPSFRIHALNGIGSPTGVDIRLVLDKGILPTIDTGIAHKEGLGQIGVGNAKVPMEVFEKALKAYQKEYLNH